jgi:hypothetical protein
MATYFTNFPSVDYYFSSNPDAKVSAVNILRRFKPVTDILDRVDIYYPYEVKDGDRPDIVAYKIYGYADYDWIILMFNQRIDPYFQWPMSNEQFNNYIDTKYGSISFATQNVHHYEWIVQPKQILIDGTIIPEKTLEVDAVTYHNLIDSERREVVYYDYEFNKNEKNRIINLIDSVYIPEILREKEKIFG